MKIEIRCPRNHFIGEFDLVPGSRHWPRCHRCSLKFEFVARERVALGA